MQRRVLDGFSILFTAAELLRIFGEKLKIYHITEVPQEYIQPRLILNMYEKNDGGTPIVNYTTYREVEPELM